jgi:hypothetical protein
VVENPTPMRSKRRIWRGLTPALFLVGAHLRLHRYPYTVTVTMVDEFETLSAKCEQFKTAKNVPMDHVEVGLRWIDRNWSAAMRYRDPEFETWVRGALKEAGGLGKVVVTFRVIPCENTRLREQVNSRRAALTSAAQGACGANGPATDCVPAQEALARFDAHLRRLASKCAESPPSSGSFESFDEPTFGKPLASARYSPGVVCASSCNCRYLRRDDRGA